MFNRKFWTEGLGSFIVAIGVALVIRWAIMEAYVIPSGSMLPTLLIHDHIFVNKMVYGTRVPFSSNWLIKHRNPEPGEIIVFKYPVDPSIFFIKRVVGIPGDTIEYKDGKVFRNGEAVEMKADAQPEHAAEFAAMSDEDFQREGGGFSESKASYLHFTEVLNSHPHSVLLNRNGEHTSPVSWTVPPGKLFVMGDNRDNSADSRRWGFVPEEYVLGRAMFVWLSCEKTLPVVSFLCNPLTVRWDRFFHKVD
ncbi:MAG: signal peptidase I [Bdellovibrionaceae bacterium]|nr:signal peptidase I [Pseudobdellovibrionaceae bacterium]